MLILLQNTKNPRIQIRFHDLPDEKYEGDRKKHTISFPLFSIILTGRVSMHLKYFFFNIYIFKRKCIRWKKIDCYENF